MLCCLLIQQVEEVLDGERDRTARAQDHREKIVHKLLQRPLTNTVKFTLEHKKVKVSALCSCLAKRIYVCVCLTL